MSDHGRQVRTVQCVVLASAAAAGANVITDENSKPGTPGWPITKWSVDACGRSIAIEGYCSQLSYAAGETLTVYVSTNPASQYTAEILRLGYNGGDPVTYHSTTYESELGGTVVNTATIFWAMPLAGNGLTPIPGHINHGGT